MFADFTLESELCDGRIGSVLFAPVSYVQSSGHRKNLTNTCPVNEHILACKDLTIVATMV